LTKEVTVKDIAEGLDRAIQDRIGVKEEFDAIVHSTGMLVIRTWLVSYAAADERCRRLKHLIGLAPATFGSPLAHKGRSLLGSIFKGNREDLFGPDFLEAGDRILNALELGSAFTWDLAHQDLFGPKAFYGSQPDTPYPFIFCGTQGYRGLRRLINDPGSDGTVRLAGCSLNARKIRLDLTQDPGRQAERARVKVEPWSSIDQIPLIPIEGIDHSTILTDPPQRLQDLVDAALRVETETDYRTWVQNNHVTIPDSIDQWQQFLVRAIDERGDPITDYHLELFSKNGDPEGTITDEFNVEVHKYSSDASLRCFHVNLTDLAKKHLSNLWLRIIASSGSRLVCYYGYGSEKSVGNATNGDGKWDAALNMYCRYNAVLEATCQQIAGPFFDGPRKACPRRLLRAAYRNTPRARRIFGSKSARLCESGRNRNRRSCNEDGRWGVSHAAPISCVVRFRLSTACRQSFIPFCYHAATRTGQTITTWTHFDRLRLCIFLWA
jgi:hypothetical protein